LGIKQAFDAYALKGPVPSEVTLVTPDFSPAPPRLAVAQTQAQRELRSSLARGSPFDPRVTQGR